MKKFFYLLTIISLAIFTTQCGSNQKVVQQGSLLSGHFVNAENQQVYLDKLNINEPNAVLVNAPIDENGNFELVFPDGMEEGVYNIRIGTSKMFLSFDGTEKNVKIDGDLNTAGQHDFSVTGSKNSTIIRNIIQGIITKQVRPAGLSTFIDTVSSPMLGVFMSYLSLGNDQLVLKKKALKRLSESNPNSPYIGQYQKLINTAESSNKRGAAGPVQVGMLAPDIKLTSPEGKTYALSELKGKVVLLDFWASWCGPCRKENPHVVSVYKKYKNQGFTVFSVSLDGVDARSRGRYGNMSEEEILASSRKRWKDAIVQDKLEWPYHVSDLKKWGAAPAKVYGVRSIPRAFLIDREGKIVSTKIRGAAQLEAELKKVL